MPGRDIFDAQGARLVHQARELHLGVAAGAGNRRAPLEVVADERGHDTVVEGALEVHDVVRDPEPAGHGARVVEVVERAAATERGTGPLGLVVELHGHAQDVVALLLEQRRGERGVHSSRHGDDDTHSRSIDGRPTG